MEPAIVIRCLTFSRNYDDDPLIMGYNFFIDPINTPFLKKGIVVDTKLHDWVFPVIEQRLTIDIINNDPDIDNIDLKRIINNYIEEMEMKIKLYNSTPVLTDVNDVASRIIDFKSKHIREFIY